MFSLNRRVEKDVGTRGRESHTELNVLDRRLREPLLIESANPLERVPSHRADPTPEGRGGSGRRVVDMMVEQISEDRNDTLCFRAVVIGSEERREPGIGRERVTDAAECIRVDLDVRIDEHEHVTGRAASARVAGGGRTGSICLSDDDDLVGTVGSNPNRLGARREGRRVVRRRNDRCQ